jgi:hypothetical protein
VPSRTLRRTTLTATDRLVVRSIAEAMFSEDGEVDETRLAAHVGQVDALVSAASRSTRAGLRLALLFLRLAPILFMFRLTTLERLPVADRVALLARLERSRAATSLAFVGWRSIMTLVFYEDPVELRALGYGEERQRYKGARALPVLPAAAAAARPAPAALPVPLESGVRLRDPDAAASNNDEQEVA